MEIYQWTFFDPSWVEKSYGLKAKEPPADWQQYTDPSYQEAFKNAAWGYAIAQDATATAEANK